MEKGELTAKHLVLNESEDGKVYKVREIAHPEKNVYTYVKRTIDIVASIIGIIVALIPMLIIALMIRIDSEGEAIYKQERLGLDGKPFTLYKFRTMYLDAEKDGARWAVKNDERITRVGKFLRLFRLDELPQLINILSGEMSVVGPRPERECFYDEFEEYIKGFRQRLYIVPGLTGLAQINGGYELKPEEKIVYDLDYIEKCSFKLDLKIMLKSFVIVFNHKGAL